MPDFFLVKDIHDVITHGGGQRNDWIRQVAKEKEMYIWSHNEETRELPGEEIMQGTMPGARRRGRPCTAWMDNIKTWTGLSVEELRVLEELIRMTDDRDKWRKYVHSVANPRIEDG